MSYKFMSVCGSGLASSFLIEMTVGEAMKELGIDGEMSHTSVGSFTPSHDLDFVIVGKDIAPSIEFERKIILDNLFDKEEVKKKLTAALATYQK